jgi:hypothetical protein
MKTRIITTHFGPVSNNLARAVAKSCRRLNRRKFFLALDVIVVGVLLAGCGRTLTPTSTAVVTTPAATATSTSLLAPATTPTLAVTAPIATRVMTPAPSDVTVPPDETSGAPIAVGFFSAGVGDVPTGVLLGGAQPGRWRSPAEISLRGGEIYQLYSAEAYLGTAQGTAPYAQPPHFLSAQLVDLTPAPQAGQEIFAIGGEWNALPRPFQVLSNDIDLYRETVAERLQVNGLVDSPVQIHQTLRVDLDGNGTEEVMIAAAHFASRQLSVVTTGDYSLILLRTVVSDSVVSIPLVENYYVTNDAPAAANQYRIMAILDLNGDGQMEIVVRGERYEGQTTVVYEVADTTSQAVLISEAGVYPNNLAYQKPAHASTSRSEEPPAQAVDGNNSTQWGAGSHPPQWIEIDLGRDYHLTEIRLLVGQWPAGDTVHRIQGRSAGGAFVELHTFRQQTREGDWLILAPDAAMAGIQILRIETLSSPSWVAWKEIQVYGDPIP